MSDDSYREDRWPDKYVVQPPGDGFTVMAPLDKNREMVCDCNDREWAERIASLLNANMEACKF